MLKYQTFLRRFVALMIDALLLSPFALLETYILKPEISPTIVIVWNIFFTTYASLYTILLHTFFGQTVGKMVMNVKVVDISENPITFGQAFLRDIVVVFYNIIVCGLVVYEISVFGVRENREENYAQTILLNILIFWQIANLAVLINNEKRRAIHDFIAGTVVIRVNLEEENRKNINGYE